MEPTLSLLSTAKSRLLDRLGIKRRKRLHAVGFQHLQFAVGGTKYSFGGQRILVEIGDQSLSARATNYYSQPSWRICNR